MSAGSFAATLRWGLVRELIARDVRLRYRGRALGFLWSQLNPIVSVVIFSVVFSTVIPLGIDDYPLFILIGIESWQWFQSGLVAGTAGVVAARDLVRHPGFPIGVLPPVLAGAQLVQFVLALPVILGALVVTTGRLPGTAAWLPPILVVQFMLCTGAAYLLATLHVFVRDTAEIVNVALRIAFFATPIIYDAERLANSRLRVLLEINPMAHLIGAQRDVLLAGRGPDVARLGAVALLATVLVVGGRAVFDRFSHRFPDEV